MTDTPKRRATASSSSVTTLSTAQCWDLLESQSLGRLAIVDPSGQLQIYPVNYATNEGVLYIRTANDAKLRHLRARSAVAFEVDGEEAGERWSVVLRGDAAQVETDAELQRSRGTTLRSMSPTVKPFVVRLEPRVISGRRFTEKPQGTTEGPVRLQTLEPPDETLPPSARRPKPIPHYSPLTDD